LVVGVGCRFKLAMLSKFPPYTRGIDIPSIINIGAIIINVSYDDDESTCIE
jgi:hypothetical protein